MSNKKKTVTIKGVTYNIEKRITKEGDTIVKPDEKLVYKASLMDVDDENWIVVKN